MLLSQTQSSEMQGPLWLFVVAAACLPFTFFMLRRLGRWWLSVKPFPLPDDGAWPAVRWPAWFGLGLFIFMVIAMSLIVIGYAALKKADLLPWEPLHVPSMFSPGTFLGQIVPPLIGLALVRLYGRGAAATIGVRVGSAWRTAAIGAAAFAAVLPLCIVALWTNTVVAHLFDIQPEIHPLLETVQKNPAVWVLPLALVQAGVLAALSEEFLYRGVLMMTLLKEAGPGAALIVSSVIFAAVHWSNEPQAMLPLFVLALMLGYLAYRTRSLLAPVVAHGLFNTVMVFATMGGAK